MLKSGGRGILGFRDRNWSGIVVTISTAIFTVVSIVSLFISLTSWQTQRETTRPYLTLKESPLVDRNDGISFEFKFENIGTHPACNLTSKTIIFDQKFTEKPLLIDEYSLVNDIPKNITTSFLLNINDEQLCHNAEISPYFVIIKLRYSDSILRKSYIQTIYLKWNGVAANKLQPFVHIEASEKDSILTYLKINNL